MDQLATRVSFRVPVFGNCIVLLTDRQIDPLDDLPAGLKNRYLCVRTFNADGSLIEEYPVEAIR